MFYFINYLLIKFFRYEREQVDNKFSGNKEYLFLSIQEDIKNTHNNQTIQSNQFENSSYSYENKVSNRPQNIKYCEQYAVRIINI